MDEQMNAADKGPEGEKRFREWLAQNKLGFVPICQQKETFATLFFGAVKRPDFLVLIDSIGIIAVDTKYKLDFVRFGSRPDPEDAVVRDVVECLIEGHDASAHVVDVFPFTPV